MAKLCAADQVTVNDPVKGVVQCLKCRTCTKGQGSSVQCGDVVPPEKPIMCQDCVLGETFSSTDGTGTCEYCFSCPEHNELTVKNCTLAANSVCGGCKPHFYRDGLTLQCEPCSPCCGDGSDIKEIECEAQGMSDNQVCNVARADKCGKTPTPPRPTVKATTPKATAVKATAVKATAVKATAVKATAVKATAAKATIAKLRSPSTGWSSSSVNASLSSVGAIGYRSAERLTSSSPDGWAMTQPEQIYVATGGSVLLVLVLGAMLYLRKHKWRPSCRRTPTPTMEEGVPEMETLVPFGSMAVDEGRQEDGERICVPTQDTEGPGKVFLQDAPLTEMLSAGSPEGALNHFEASSVVMVKMDRGARFLDGVFRFDADTERYNAIIGEASLSPQETRV